LLLISSKIILFCYFTPTRPSCVPLSHFAISVVGKMYVHERLYLLVV